MKPSLADRAYFYELQGLSLEWIAYRLGLQQGHTKRLIREGRERSEQELLKSTLILVEAA